MAKRYPSPMRATQSFAGNQNGRNQPQQGHQVHVKGVIKTMKSGFGFITPTEDLPHNFTQKDVFFSFKVLPSEDKPDIGETVTFALYTNRNDSYDKPSAKMVWRECSSNMSPMRSFGSTQSLNSGVSNLSRHKSSSCRSLADFESVSSNCRDSETSDTWYEGSIVRSGTQLRIKPFNNVNRTLLSFDFSDVRGQKVNENDNVRFKVNDDMLVQVVCLQKETNESRPSDGSDDETEQPQVKRFKSSSKQTSGIKKSSNHESVFSMHKHFVGSGQLLGIIVAISGDIGFLRPENDLPEGYKQDKDVFFKLDFVRSAGVALQRGDIIRFTLSTKEKARPRALNMAVVKFRHRPENEIIEIISNLEKCLGQPAPETDSEYDTPDDVRQQKKSKTASLIDFMSSAALWQCLGNRQHATDQAIHQMLQLVLKIHQEIRGMKQAFRLVLNTLMESPLCNPWSSPLKNCIKRCSQEQDHDMLKTFQDFFLLVLKYATEKSRSVVCLIKEMCSFQGHERFLFDSLKAVSKCTSNDTCDLPWDDVPLTPTTDELLTKPDEDYLSLMPVSGSYQSTEEYFDTYFRLLRADCFDSLRKGIQNLLKGCLDDRDMNVYIHVAFAGVQVKKMDSGLEIVLKVSPQREVKNWHTCSNLMFGNLLCISPSGDFKDVIWATVSNRDPELLKKKQLILVEFCTPCNTMTDSEAVVLLAYSSGNMIMVESPTYYRAYHPVLKSLQAANIDDMPFQDELVFGRSFRTSSAPDYVPSPQILEHTKQQKASTLDEYQSDAWSHAFQHRVACIQGPPGTGKTYIGIKIVESILSFKSCPSSPILVLTYKNHALDEFLKGILKFMPEGLVRVGSRSGDKDLEKLNLNDLSRNMPKEQSLMKTIMETKDELSTLQAALESSVNSLAKSRYLSLDTLLMFLQPNQLFSLLEGQKKIFSDDVTNISKLCQTLQENPEANNERKYLAVAFKSWCPDEKFIKEVQDSYINMIDVDISTKESNTRTEESGDIFDEKDIEDLEKERLSGITKKSVNEKNLIVFTHKSEIKPEVRLFSISKIFVSRLPMLKLMNVTDVWSLNKHDRVKLLQCLLVQQAQEASDSFDKHLQHYQEVCERKTELENQHKINVLASQKIIGMTITGASINQNLLVHVKPAIVMVEEAAEVLEAQMIPTLGPWVEHLILIGDHMQLRPQVESYTLVTKYNFDVSMMERLIKNKTTHASLNLQNRMKVEFAVLLKDIYPKLESNLDQVKSHEKPKCMEKSMYFWEHTDQETAGRSYTNELEAARTVQLATYMVLQGIHPSQITILAPYQGQVGLLRRKVRETEQKWTSYFPVHTGHGKEDIKQNRISVHTIDMFQGDENDIIIVSLVRSNEKGKLGFLKTLNRRCVAQSRSKCGMYFIGNASTLRQNKHWRTLHQAMSEKQCTGNKITFICAKHPLSKVSAQSAIDVPLTLSFCKIPCHEELKCQKHRCKKPCQPPHPHKICAETCWELMACEMHMCMRDCYPFHRHDVCEENIDYIHSGCGHAQIKKCSESEPICKEKVIFEFPCKHIIEKRCYQDSTKLKCKQPCSKKLPKCGHMCENRCSDPCTNVDNCKTCARQRKQEEIKKLLFEEQQRELAKISAQEELEKILNEADVIKVTEISAGCESTLAEYNTVTQFVQRGFPKPVDHEVIVEKIEKILHIGAKKAWLTKTTQLFDPQQNDRKFLKVKTDSVQQLKKNNFGINATQGTYGQAVYMSSCLFDVGTDDSDSSSKQYTTLIVDVLIGQHKVVTQQSSKVYITSLDQMKCDSIYNRSVAIANRYVADEIAVQSPEAVLPLYLVNYRLKTIETQQNKLETEALAGSGDQLVTYIIKPSRELEANDPLQHEYRTVESQFHRLLAFQAKNLAFQDKNLTENKDELKKCEIESVEYYIKPSLLRKFIDKEIEMKEKYGDARESKRILAFHGTKKENEQGIVENNFDLKKLSAATGDEGWYGAGIYLSEFPQTSLFYGESLILCKVLPGKSYDIPVSVTDLKLGKKLEKGYDSHRVNTQDKGYGEELVIFNPDQILPCYVINYKIKQRGKRQK